MSEAYRRLEEWGTVIAVGRVFAIVIDDDASCDGKCVRLLSEDDDYWGPYEGVFSSHWLADLAQVVAQANALLSSPSASPSDSPPRAGSGA